MDLHYDQLPNPAWDDGKALENMWRKKLEDEIPNTDRQEDKAHCVGSRGARRLGATFTARRPIRLRENAQHSVHTPANAKRPHPFRDGCTEESPSKRSKSNGGGD